MFEIPQREVWLRRWVIPVAWVLGVALLIGVAWALLRALSADTGRDQPDSVVSQIDRGDVTAVVNGYGKLLPRESRVLLAEVDGRVARVDAFAGASVRAGQVIVTLRNPQLKQRLAQADNAVLEARANLESATARLQQELLSARGEVELAQSDVDLAKRKLHMLDVLLEQHIVSRLDSLEAGIALTKARLRHKLAVQKLAAIETATKAELRAKRLHLSSTESDLEAAKTDLVKLSVRAAEDGVLSILNDAIEPGAMVHRGDVVGQLSNPASLYAEIQVSAGDAPRVVAGQQAFIRIRGQRFRGTVARVDPSVVDGQVRTEIALAEAPGDAALANLDVSARIVTARAEGVLRAPLPAWIHLGDTQAPIFVEEGAYFERKMVTLGVIGSSYMEIQAAVKPGQRIVLPDPASRPGVARIAKEVMYD